MRFGLSAPKRRELSDNLKYKESKATQKETVREGAAGRRAGQRAGRRPGAYHSGRLCGSAADAVPLLPATSMPALTGASECSTRRACPARRLPPIHWRAAPRLQPVRSPVPSLSPAAPVRRCSRSAPIQRETVEPHAALSHPSAPASPFNKLPLCPSFPPSLIS